AFTLRPLKIYEITKALLINDDCDNFPVKEILDSMNEDYINIEILSLCRLLLKVQSTLLEPHIRLKIVHLTQFYLSNILPDKHRLEKAL
ncbi:hypothetical protein K469DRAFT_574026, partial [Zopfia rhizophila CBS 207.26]